jgi:hypothetical protein
MAWRIEGPEHGIFEKEPGTGVWWIRYTDGAVKYKREKVGRRLDAVALYQKRKTSARMRHKMLENIRHKGRHAPATCRRDPDPH